MRRKIRVLVVDDSAFIRKVVSEMLASHPSIEVAGTAHDGEDALQKVEILKPDVVTLDLQMPRLDGVGFLREQMKRRPLPVVICSIVSETGQLALDAFEAGAVEYVQKPRSLKLPEIYEIRQDLIRKVLAAAIVSQEQLDRLLRQQKTAPPPAPAVEFRQKLPWDAILIGASTGGPGSLRQILPSFPANFPAPIGVVIHMPAGYTRFFAERLDEICPLKVVEAEQGLPFQPGYIVIGKAGAPFRLQRKSDGVYCDISGSSAEPFVPSVNDLFASAAEVFGARALGIVLTGMGNDGTAGASWLKAQGATVIAESERTAVIYGMPHAVAEAGLADLVLDLEEIVPTILKQLQ
jgi:two-component system chemotaxis response regulator CheB